MDKISIIITTYNRPHLLGRAVESARRAGQNVEIIVVDDASRDETAEICRSLRGIKYIRAAKNCGVAGARNLGLQASTGEYISFLDDDDLRLPGSLDAQLALLEKSPTAGMIYARVFFGDENCCPKDTSYPENCPAGDVFGELLQTNFIPCQSVVLRRSCLDRIGWLDETAAGVDDWDLWVRIAEHFPVIFFATPVAIWRQPTADSGQISRHPEKMHRAAYRLHRTKWLELPRAQNFSAAVRQKIVRRFIETSAQQLVWESAERLKALRLRECARIIASLGRMYPLTGSRLLCRFLIKSALRRTKKLFENS